MRTGSTLIRYFLLAMLVLTFVSWKLDGARTPLVQAVAASSGMLPDEAGEMTFYSCIVPQEALMAQEGGWFVYLLEPASDRAGNSTPRFTAVQTQVNVLARDGDLAAVSGVYADDMPIVLYSTRPLRQKAVPVKLWTGEREGGQS